MDQQIRYNRLHTIHDACHALCRTALWYCPAVAGNIAIFAQSDAEYMDACIRRDQVTIWSSNPLQKYYQLMKPYVIPWDDADGEVVYTHLYIRKHDANMTCLGDVDFVVDEIVYEDLKLSVLWGVAHNDMRIYDRPGRDMIEVYAPDAPAIAYITTKEMAQKVHVVF